MVRLGLVLICLALPVRAACFGPPLPTEVTFANGNVIRILSHTAQDLTYRATLPDGSEAVMTTREGLFAITSSRNGALVHFTWLDPLPRLADLAPGDAATLRADMVVQHAYTSGFTSSYKVLRQDRVTVQGCDYPVIVVSRTDVEGGKTVADLVLWLSPALRFPLKTEAAAGGQRFFHAVTAMR